MTFLLQTILL